MTNGKRVALAAGVAGALALGVWSVPRVIDSQRPSGDLVTAVSEPATPPIVETATARRRPSAARSVAVLPASTPALHDRLKPVLNRGTRVDVAAEGFTSAEQFATVAYAARNTDVPFMVLKHRVLEEGKTLAAAIRESRPGVNAAAEAVRARAEARQEIAALVG